MANWTLTGTTATCTNAAANTTITVENVKSIDGLSIDDGKVIVSNASLNGTDVTISCTKTNDADSTAATTYTLALGTDIPKTVKSGATAAWKVSGTTATYGIDAVTSYALDSGTGTIKYSENGYDAGTFTYATVTGLKSGLDSDTAATALKVSGDNITVNANAFDNTKNNSKVTLTNGTDESGTTKTYKLVVDATVNATSYAWNYSGVKAEYKKTVPLQFESSGTEITAVKGSKAATATLATLNGLKKDLSNIDSVLTVSGDKITVKTDALTSTTVKFTNGKDTTDNNKVSTYKLAVTGDYLKSNAAAVPAWVVSGSTAKYYTDTTAFTQVPGYAVTDTQITYTAAKVDSKVSPAITITNLKSSELVLDAMGQVSGIEIDPLNTKVKIADSLLNKNKILLSGADSNGKAYTFKFDSESEVITNNTDIEAMKNGKNIEFRQTISTGYTLSSNGKSIFYNGKNEDQTISIAKISGINAELDWSNDDKEWTSSVYSDDLSFDETTGVITLGSGALANGKVTITGDAGYTLAINSTVDASETGTDPELVLNKNTATYGIHTTEGYELSADGKTLTYVKDSVKAQATITGVNTSLYDIAKQAVASSTTSTVYDLLTNGEIDPEKVAIYYDTEIEAAVYAGTFADEDAAKAYYVAQEQAKYDAEIAAKVATYIKFDKAAGTVTLSKEALGTSAIKLKITKDADDYDLELASGIITSKEDSEQESNYVTTWEVKGTNATYQTYKPAYYTVTSSKAGDKDIKYNKAIAVKTPDIALSGLAKDLSVVSEGTSGISGIALDTDNKVVTLDLKVLGTGTIKVTKGDYTLKLGSGFDTDRTETRTDTTDDISTSKYSFTSKGNGKFELTQTKLEGYELAADKKSVTLITSKSKKEVAVAALTGISGSSITVDTDVTLDPDVTLDHDNRTITIVNEDLLGNVTETAKLAVSGSGGYTLQLDNSLKASTEENWVVEKGKVIYRQTITGSGFAVSADGKSITKVSTDTKAVDLFTITGLNTEALEAIEADASKVSDYITLGTDDVLTLSKAAVGSSAIKLATKGKYTLDLSSDIRQTEDTSGTSKGWVVKGKEATYQNIAQGYYTLDAKKTSVAYKAPTAGSGSATVTLKGLKGGLKVNGDGTITGIDYNSSKEIKLSNEVLGGTNVSVEGGNFVLALAEDVETSTEVSAPVWTIKKTTATYTQKPASGYAVSGDGKSITYTKPGAVATMATLTGLPTSVSETLGDGEVSATKIANYIKINENKITVTAELVGNSKSITLKNGKDTSGTATTYTLGIGNSLEPAEKEEVQWYVKNTTAQYINCTNVHYELAKDDTVINRVDVAPVAGATAFLTINGIKKGSVLTNSNATVSTSTVTLSNDLLNNATVTLVGTGAYENCKLAFKDTTSYTTADQLTTKWSTSGTKATLKQSKPAGYSLSADGKTMTYLKAAKDEAVATVSGLANDKKMETKLSSGSVTDLKLTTTDLSKAVTVDGIGYKFIFANDYSGTAANAINTIKGGAKVDNIQAAGNYLKIETAAGDDIITATGSDNVINAGKGDDTITLGTGSNTIIYNSGDGNDVIKNYASDTIQVGLTARELENAANDIAYDTDGSNIVLTVTKGKAVGTMTLSGVTDISKVKVVDKAGGEVTLTAPTTEPTGSDFIGSGLVAEEFYDTNYIGSANDLGDIISGDATFSVGDIETSDATDLTKQNTTIVASTGK